MGQTPTQAPERGSGVKDASTKAKVCPACDSGRWCGRPCSNHAEGRAEAARRALATAEASAAHLGRTTTGPKRVKRPSRKGKPTGRARKA